MWTTAALVVSFSLIQTLSPSLSASVLRENGYMIASTAITLKPSVTKGARYFLGYLHTQRSVTHTRKSVCNNISLAVPRSRNSRSVTKSELGIVDLGLGRPLTHCWPKFDILSPHSAEGSPSSRNIDSIASMILYLTPITSTLVIKTSEIRGRETSHLLSNA